MRLPRSSASRAAPGFHRLLTTVDLYAPAGLQFRGQLLTPGADFRIADLPRPAILLENAGAVRIAAARSRYSFEDLWLLWQFDFDDERWVEVVRTTATDASWTLHVAPIAYRLLNPSPPPAAELRAAPAAERLTSLIGSEIGELEHEVRCYVLAALDRYLASAIVAATAEISVRPAASGDGGFVFPRIGAHVGRELGDLRPRGKSLAAGGWDAQR